MTGQYMYSQNYAHTPYPGAGLQQYPQHHAGYAQPQSYGPVVQGYGGQPAQSPYQQSCHKKPSVRNGDVMKRCRLQAA